MSDDLLRQYHPCQCMDDGYPYAWHYETQAADQSNRQPGDGPRLEPPIKDLIREQADHRCLRCGHPYPPGITTTPCGKCDGAPSEVQAECATCGGTGKAYPRGEWTPCDEGCMHGGPFGYFDVDKTLVEEHVLGSWSANWAREYAEKNGWTAASRWRILTVHHLDEDKANCRWWNLAALCQRCHLRMQRAVVMGRPYNYEHSTWFKPFAAGFYAWKYLGEDLTREETIERLDELLALEHRFTQEALL